MPPDHVYELLTRISRLLQAEERSESGLLPVQWHALDYLSRCNRYSDRPKALTEYLGVTKGTSSQTLKTLVDRGWVEKSEDPDDGRVVRLRLTALGRRLVRRSIPPARVRQSLGELPANERAALESQLTALLRMLQRAGSNRTFGLCHTCRHFERLAEASFRCGLTSEKLSERDRNLICREHEDDPVRAAG